MNLRFLTLSILGFTARPNMGSRWTFQRGLSMLGFKADGSAFTTNTSNRTQPSANLSQTVFQEVGLHQEGADSEMIQASGKVARSSNATMNEHKSLNETKGEENAALSTQQLISERHDFVSKDELKRQSTRPGLMRRMSRAECSTVVGNTNYPICVVAGGPNGKAANPNQDWYNTNAWRIDVMNGPVSSYQQGTGQNPGTGFCGVTGHYPDSPGEGAVMVYIGANNQAVHTLWNWCVARGRAMNQDTVLIRAKDPNSGTNAAFLVGTHGTSEGTYEHLQPYFIEANPAQDEYYSVIAHNSPNKLMFLG